MSACGGGGYGARASVFSDWSRGLFGGVSLCDQEVQTGVTGAQLSKEHTSHRSIVVLRLSLMLGSCFYVMRICSSGGCFLWFRASIFFLYIDYYYLLHVT